MTYSTDPNFMEDLAAKIRLVILAQALIEVWDFLKIYIYILRYRPHVAF